MADKSSKFGVKSHTAYSGGNSKVASEAMSATNGFKKGGKIGMKGNSVMSEAHEGRKARKSGGGVLSSAAAGSPRGKCANY